MNNRRNSTFLAFLPYAVGAIIGLYLVVIAAWADMEAAFYGFSRLANAGLKGFSCPVVMSDTETRSVSLTIYNNTDSPISPTVKTEISTSFLAEEYLENLELAAGETKTLEWPVGPDNVDLDQFIFAKVLMFSAFPLPNREATCGIFMLNLPVSGRFVLPVLVVLSLLGMGWGLYGMNKSAASNIWLEKHIRPMLFLGVVIVLGMIVSFSGGWVPSVLLLAVALLMVIILLGSFLMSERRQE